MHKSSMLISSPEDIKAIKLIFCTFSDSDKADFKFKRMPNEHPRYDAGKENSLRWY